MARKNIFLRGNIWHIRYTSRGRQVRESSESSVFDDADRLLKKRQGEVVTGRFSGLSSERITMGELLAGVEEDYEENGRRSLTQLRSRLKHLKPAFDTIRAADFTSDHLRRYRSKRLKDEASRATINREVETLARAWNLGLRCDPPKVARHFYFPMYDEDNVRTEFLEDDNYQALHDALPAYLKPLLLVAYHVPCRLGELTNLFMTQLDFKANVIVLNPGETKNKAGRQMPMFGPMCECLLMQKSIRDAKFRKCRYAFFGETGERIVDFRKAWASACKKAGVEGLIFHDLRRSAARNMRRAGVPENTIMKIAGWKTPAMFRRYDIQDGRDIQRAAEIMEKQLAEKKAISTVSSTMDQKEQVETDGRTASKVLN
jgi:integrase